MNKQKTTKYWRKRYKGEYRVEHTSLFSNSADGLALLVEDYATREDERYDFISETVVPHSLEEMDRVVLRYQDQERQKERQRQSDEEELYRLAEKLERKII